MKPRLLSKSRFKLAQECPRKLAYTGKKEYGNTMANDPFLRALAEGGFQVGALAKLYFPTGVDLESQSYEEAILTTAELIKKKDVVIFEATFQHRKLLVRVDVLEKKGDTISLYEVKSKSYHPDDDYFFQKKAKKLMANWDAYLHDIAFQAFVVKGAHPKLTVNSFLYLINKASRTSIDGLNQNFLLARSEDGRNKTITKKRLTPEEIGNEILIPVPVNDEVQFIHDSKYEGKIFAEWVEFLATHYEKDKPIDAILSSECKHCEFRIGEEEKVQGLKSGFEECWKPQTKKPLAKPLVIDLWNFRGAPKAMEEKKYFMADLERTDINPEARKEDQGEGISQKERQWIQVEKEKKGDTTPFLDIQGLSREMNSWKYPLHFIDFETAGVAIPFNKNRRPYEQIAFQFSHHQVHKDGRVEHKGEYIHMERGKFPNFEFIRALKKELENDNGTIFRYAAHENTVLCTIHKQLQDSDLPKKEIEELSKFIESITKKKGDKEVLWEGSRNMVDMRDLVLRYYFHPLTGGSNSLKYVLPATLNESKHLQDKYSKPIYGSKDGIASNNYKNKQWIQKDAKGKIIDPYHSLEPIFSPEEDAVIQAMYPETELADGGAAMMAFARMQFTEMEEAEAQRIKQALLRYCELDTLAMVMLVEYWQHATGQQKQKAA